MALVRSFFTLAPHDWLVAAYLVPIGLAVGLRSPAHLADGLALLPLLTSLGYLAWARVYHGLGRRPGWLTAVYHLSAIPALGLTYFRLRTILPLVNPQPADAALARVDVAVLGGHLSVWLERWATPFTVEWFSAAYQSYMYLGAGLILAALLLDRDRKRQAEFGLSTLLLFLGQLGYLVLPARGPLAFLESQYAGPLPGGLLHAHVVATQVNAGPIFDAFPSMHTAVTFCFVLFARRHFPRARWLGYVLGAQILFSTVFLRYHYVVDVAAGLVWGGFAFFAARPLLRRYQQKQVALGLRDGEAW